MANFSTGKDFVASDEMLDQLNEQNVHGVITLENVIERILQMDIKDEKDAD
jgi:CBS domain containing-hemolysin-like protein